MAEDKVALTREKDDLTLALKTLEDQKPGLQQPVLHEREGYSSVRTNLDHTMLLNRPLILHTASKRSSRRNR